MTADALTLQLKLPPPGVPLPPTHISEAVAEGAPVVENLAVTSLWCMHVLKLLAMVGGSVGRVTGWVVVGDSTGQGLQHLQHLPHLPVNAPGDCTIT